MATMLTALNKELGNLGKPPGVQQTEARAMNDLVPEAPIRVFLLIENRLLRDALERLFRKRPDLLIVGCDEPHGIPRETFLGKPCDVVVLDFFDPDWLPSNPIDGTAPSAPPKAVLIGMSDESEQFIAAIRGGVAGYLLKEASAAEVVAAVRSTYRGEAVCPAKLCSLLFQFVWKAGLRNSASIPDATERPSLTLRQQKLIGLVAKGLTNKEIASRLNISQYTVRNHIHRIFKSVDAESRSEAVETLRLHGYTLNVSDKPQQAQGIKSEAGAI